MSAALTALGRTIALGFRGLGRPLAWLAVGAVAATTATVHGLGSDPSAGEARGEGDALWLHLPCVVLTAVFPVWLCTLWPPIGRDRTGAQAVRRLARGPLEGSGCVLAGGVTALVLALGATGAGWALLMGGSGRPLPEASRRVAVRFEPLAAFVGHPLRGRLERPQTVAALDLRVTYLAGVGNSLATGLRFWADGQPLGPERIDVDVVRDVVHLRFHPREIQDVRIHVLDGQPLTVREGHASARGPGGLPAWRNGLSAALSYAPLGLLAGAAIVLLRRRIALPLARLLGLATAIVGALLGWGGTATNIAKLGAGTQIDTRSLWAESWQILAASGALLAVASLVGLRAIARPR